MKMTNPSRRSRLAKWCGAAVGVVAIGATGLVFAPPASAASDPWISVPADGYYRFTLPQAAVQTAIGSAPASVLAQGTFGPSGTIANLTLEKNGSNFVATVGPLQPGQYQYQFTATTSAGEKVSFRNPASPVAVTSRPNWNTLFVNGESVAWMADLDGGGEIAPLTYTSGGAQKQAVVWTPPGYDAARAEAYPVLYLQNDAGQGFREWLELGRAEQILDNLAEGGNLADMVVVMGDGNGSSPRAELLDRLIPAARGAFNISDDPAKQALAGVGLSGKVALNSLLSDTGEFAFVGAFSSGGIDGSISAAKAADINSSTDLVRVYVGNSTDAGYDDNYELLQTFENAGVEYQFDGVNQDAGWDAWQEDLLDFAPRVFRDAGTPGPTEGHGPLDGPRSLPATGTTPTPWLAEDNTITFETGTEYAGAKEVTVWGNWSPNGAWLRIPMTKVGDRWRVTVGPVDGGLYYYKFVVDGVDKKDAGNPVQWTTEVNWSPIVVPGEGSPARYLVDAEESKRGDVSVLDFQSTANDEQRKAYVWTPPGYDPDRAEPYPVFVLNHGAGQSWTDWVEVGRAGQILDNLYAEGSLSPMVVVMPNGNGVNYQNELFQRLLPAAEAEYNISTEGKDRAIAGLSMGSQNAIRTVLGYPGEFAYAAGFSAFIFGDVAGTDVAAVNAGTKLFRLYTGDITDFTYANTHALVDTFTKAGITHEFAGVTTGPHGWDTWQQNLIDFAPRLFKAGTGASVPISATIGEGENGSLALTVADFGEGVALSEPANAGDRLQFTGSLPEVTVTDSRTAQQAGSGGWAVSGQSGAFSSDGQSLTAGHLGWTPKVLTARPGLSAGAPVPTVLDGGPGLAEPSRLAEADAEGRYGSASLGAGLLLEVPVGTQPGTYSGVLTMSLFPVD